MISFRTCHHYVMQLNPNIFLWLDRYNYLMSRIKEGGVYFNGANTLSAHQCEAAKRIITPLLTKGKVNNVFKGRL